MKEKVFDFIWEVFTKAREEQGKCNRLPILMGPEELKTLEEAVESYFDYLFPEPLREILPLVFNRIRKGDNKYGPHPGPKRAFGALRNEYNELKTELDAEDSSPISVFEEGLDVSAMALKFLRDYSYPEYLEANKKPEMRASVDWLPEVKGKIVIVDPDGWDRRNFFYSFNVEQITLDEFVRRVQRSTCSFPDGDAWETWCKNMSVW